MGLFTYYNAKDAIFSMWKKVLSKAKLLFFCKALITEESANQKKTLVSRHLKPSGHYFLPDAKFVPIAKIMKPGTTEKLRLVL